MSMSVFTQSKIHMKKRRTSGQRVELTGRVPHSWTLSTEEAECLTCSKDFMAINLRSQQLCRGHAVIISFSPRKRNLG